jgi:hypothetical protein
MKLLIKLLHLCLGGCPHSHTYRERRELYGVQILHLVCEECGHAVPALARTAEEHQHVVQAGAVKLNKARSYPVDVLALQARRRHTFEPRRAVN